MRYLLATTFLFFSLQVVAQTLEDKKITKETHDWLKAEMCIRLAARYLVSEENLSLQQSVGRAASECSDKIDQVVLNTLENPDVDAARERDNISYERAARMIFDEHVFQMKLRVIDELKREAQ